MSAPTVCLDLEAELQQLTELARLEVAGGWDRFTIASKLPPVGIEHLRAWNAYLSARHGVDQRLEPSIRRLRDEDPC